MILGRRPEKDVCSWWLSDLRALGNPIVSFLYLLNTKNDDIMWDTHAPSSTLILGSVVLTHTQEAVLVLVSSDPIAFDFRIAHHESSKQSLVCLFILIHQIRGPFLLLKCTISGNV